MSSTQNPRVRGAFTLVEMLVVLSIISVLAALLFTAFTSVREKGRQAICASNLKQIGIAFSLYTDDNSHLFPPTLTVTPPSYKKWTSWSDSVAPYVKNQQIYWCPNDTLPFSGVGTPTNSYGYNFYIGGGLGVAPLSRIFREARPDSQIVRPSATLLMSESGTVATEGIPSSQWRVTKDFMICDAQAHTTPKPATSIYTSPHARHRGRAEILWVDGHVSALPIEAFYNAPEHKRPQDKFTGISPCFRPDMGCD